MMGKWIRDREYPGLEEYFVEGNLAAWLHKRPHYCDRGHWEVNCELPGIDDADRFPRYYMDYETAKKETERFVEWRMSRGLTMSDFLEKSGDTSTT